MTTRQEVVDHWQSRLAEAERHDNGDSRSGWMQTVYRRIYKFLLRCYGKASWSTQPLDRQADETQPLLDIDPNGGKPARTAGAIQSTLKRVHTANDENAVPAGPLAFTQPGKLDWVGVAEFRDWFSAYTFVNRLARFDIPARRKRHGRKHFVLVQRRDFDAALEKHQRWYKRPDEASGEDRPTGPPLTVVDTRSPAIKTLDTVATWGALTVLGFGLVVCSVLAIFAWWSAVSFVERLATVLVVTALAAALLWFDRRRWRNLVRRRFERPRR